MPATYTLIASNTLSSSAASVTFSSIPATYTDLVLRASLRDDTASVSSNGFYIFPNSSNANGSATTVYGQPTTVGSYRTTPILITGEGNSATSNTFGSFELYIPSYTASQYKPMSVNMAVETNATAAWIEATAGLWSNTAAITSLQLDPYGTANFVSGSSFFLYGIKNS